MNVNLKTLTAGVLFFTGQALMAQEVKKDSSVVKEKEIGEVVVIGYQKKKAEQVSSAVTVVSGESLSKFSASTMGTNALQGKVSGVEITALNGKPGTGAEISIRGLGNVTAKVGASSPLFVIDGFIVGNDENAQNIFNSISPNDYESISVLKDAAAAAIYGSQGANGVIVLTTKSGKLGRPVISFKSSMGFSKKIDDINFKMMNAVEKVEYERKMASLGIAGYKNYTDTDVAALIAQDHNWQKDILRNSFIESYLFGIRGGSGKTKYAFSLGYDSDNGIIRNIDAYERYTGRMKIDATPTDRFSLGGSMGGNYTELANQRDRNNIQNPFRAIYLYNPYEPVYVNGDYNPTKQGFPILEALINQPNTNQKVIFDGNIYAQYKILDGLIAKTQLGGYFSNTRRTRKIIKGSYLDRVLGGDGNVTERNNNVFKFTNSNTLNYIKSFGKHNIDVLGLLEYSEYKNDYIHVTAGKLSSPSLTELSNTSKPTGAYGYNDLYRTFSYGAFLTYDYDNRYVLTTSIRRDADSRFGKNNVFSDPFWSVSLAWNVTNENFLKDSDILSQLKLRASLGTRGYNNIDLNLNNVLLEGGAYGDYPTIAPKWQYGNVDLKWEASKSFNVGAEFGLFNNRITGTVDYFKDMKQEFLFDVPNLGSEGGAYSATINAGNIENKGVEFSLNAQVIKSKDFNWSVRLNSTYMDYKLKNLFDGEKERNVGINILREGLKPWTFFLVRSAGINPENGNEIYLDKDGNPTEIYSPSHAVAIEGKSPQPKYFGGFGTTFSYRGFDLSADFTYKYGNYTYNYMAFHMLDYTQATSNKRVDALNYWKEKGQTGVLPRPNTTSDAPGNIVGPQHTDRFLQDASYLRLRNLSIGYTLDKRTFSQLPVNKIRFSVTGQNLATWTKYEGEPEVGIGSGESQTEAGQSFVRGAYSLYSYPQVKTYLFGIELEF